MSEEKSVFVTVVAWIFIVITGIATVISLFQNLMIRTMFTGEMRDSLNRSEGMSRAPDFAQFMFGNAELLFMLFFVLCLLGLVASIGLLRRKNWARWFFIILLGLGIVWNIAGLYLQSVIMPDMAELEGGRMPEHFRSMMGTMRIMSFLMAGVFSALFLWVIVKLCSKRIANEFKST